jgi:hypothetical protein
MNNPIRDGLDPVTHTIIPDTWIEVACLALGIQADKLDEQFRVLTNGANYVNYTPALASRMDEMVEHRYTLAQLNAIDRASAAFMVGAWREMPFYLVTDEDIARVLTERPWKRTRVEQKMWRKKNKWTPTPGQP